MASFNDARAAQQDIPVVAGPAPTVVDDSAARTVSAFGQLAGDVRKGIIAAGLEDDLQEAGNIITTLNDPRVEVSELEGPTQGGERLPARVDISGVPFSDDINQTSERFSSLRLAREQGLISPERAAQEAERILRSAISRAPGFSAEFRQQAAQELGFDPSGAVLGTLFGQQPFGSKGGKRLTRIEKMQEEAEFLAAGNPNTSPDIEFQKLQIEAQAVLRNNLMQAEIGLAKSMTPALSQRVSGDAEAGFAVVLGSFAAGPDGFENPDQVKAALRQERITRRKEARKMVNETNSLVPFEDIEGAIESVFQDYITLVDNKDALSQLQNSVALKNAIFDQTLQNYLPTLMIVSRIKGGIEFLDRLVIAADGNAARFEEIANTHGTLGTEMLVLSGLTEQRLFDSGARALDPNADPSKSPDPELDAHTRRLAAAAGLREGSAEMAEPAIAKMVQLGQERASQSAAGTFPGSFNLVGKGNQTAIVSQFPGLVARTVIDITESALATNGVLTFDPTTNKFVVRSQDLALGADSRNLSLSENTQQGVDRTSLDFLNDSSLQLVKQPEWMQALGFSSVEDFVVQTMTQAADVRVIQSERAAAAAEIDPGQALQVPILGGRPRFDLLGGGSGGAGGATAQAAPTQAAEVITEPTLIRTPDGQIQLVNQGAVQDNNALIRQAITKSPRVEQGHSPFIVAGITQAAAARGIDPRLALALALVESNLDPAAANPKSSALGLFQNTDANFIDFGNGGDRTDPDVSIDAGMNFLEFLIKRFDGDLNEVLIRWHDGQNSEGESPEGIKFREKVLKHLR